MQCKIEGTMTLTPEQVQRVMPRAEVQPAATITETDVLRIATRAVQIYAESHPRPAHVTMKDAAEMLTLSRQTVSKMVKFGTFKLNKCGLIPILQIDAALASRER